MHLHNKYFIKLYKSCLWYQFQEEMLNKKTVTKKHMLLFGSRSQHFKHLLQNTKPQEMTNESSSPIPPKKS